MLSDRPLTGRAAARRVLLCLLLLGVLVHGQAGVLRQLLGAAHWHKAMAAQRSGLSSAATGWWPQLQAWRQQLQAHRPLVADLAHAGHHHADNARHRHDAHDHTVVAIEPGDDGADPLAEPLAGSVLQPLGLAWHLSWPLLAALAAPWPRQAAVAWRDAVMHPPERPPRG